MSSQEPVVRLLLIDDKLEDAEHSISLLRNGGIPVRPSRPESLKELEATLAGAGCDLVLASHTAASIPFSMVAEALTSSSKDITLIALLDQPDEANLDDIFAKGARNFALRGRAALLSWRGTACPRPKVAGRFSTVEWLRP